MPEREKASGLGAQPVSSPSGLGNLHAERGQSFRLGGKDSREMAGDRRQRGNYITLATMHVYPECHALHREKEDM
jgi:hypothetical protein